ncbi:imm11 family protein [Mesorhizobium sp. LjRoot246]|uniref:imm11 family protein n=1 Tax=Mesorhizobium sp. LjRoot246 TaxID=3342294 RepID=UPI003ECDE957
MAGGLVQDGSGCRVVTRDSATPTCCLFEYSVQVEEPDCVSFAAHAFRVPGLGAKTGEPGGRNSTISKRGLLAVGASVGLSYAMALAFVGKAEAHLLHPQGIAQKETEMTVYTIFDDTGEDYSPGFALLDGDMKKVLPIGFEFHPVTNRAKLSDGTSVKKKEFYQGVRVDPTHLPTKVIMKGRKRELTDLQRAHNIFLVSDSFRQVVEGLEPGIHLFKPVELVWEDGSHAASYFWFYPCVRLDGMDRKHTTHELTDVGLWINKPGGQYVVNLEQVAGHHVWIDPRMNSFDLPFVSGAFKRAMADAGVRGIGYHELPTIPRVK